MGKEIVGMGGGGELLGRPLDLPSSWPGVSVALWYTSTEYNSDDVFCKIFRAKRAGTTSTFHISSSWSLQNDSTSPVLDLCRMINI